MREVPSHWAGALLVCGKCSKKVGGGFGRRGKTPLAKALRRALRLGRGREAVLGLVETKCLKLCPKRAVTLVDTRRPGEWLIVPEGAEMEEVIGRLMPPSSELRRASPT